ncbi:cation:proton antiporter [bacterium]|nr:cation:proton antiporter [bacterium]
MSGALGWDWRASVLFGFIITMSSTAVAIKIVAELKETKSAVGELTVGLMIAQDIAVVPMLILVESFEQETIELAPTLVRLGIALGILAFVLYFFRAGRQIIAPFSERLQGRDDLIALLALAVCFGAASLGGVLDLSPAYGAFVAGLIVGNTNLQNESMRVVTPIQSLLLVVFFLSVGLLIDLTYIAENALLVLGAAFGIILFKTGLNLASLRIAGVETAQASQVGLATAQIGEFSFILAAAGLSASILDEDRYRFAITVIAATLIVSPIWMIVARRVHDRAAAMLPILRGGASDQNS